jgi:hypothetical protein
MGIRIFVDHSVYILPNIVRVCIQYVTYIYIVQRRVAARSGGDQ